MDGPGGCCAKQNNPNTERQTPYDLTYMCNLKYTNSDFPSGPVVGNLPANSGATGLTPGLGRFHMLGQLSLRTATAEARALWTLCSMTREANTMRSLCTPTREQPPLAAARESPWAAVKTQCSQK